MKIVQESFGKRNARVVDLSLQGPVKIAGGLARFYLGGLIEQHRCDFHARQALRADVVLRQRRSQPASSPATPRDNTADDATTVSRQAGLPRAERNWSIASVNSSSNWAPILSDAPKWILSHSPYRVYSIPRTNTRGNTGAIIYMMAVVILLFYVAVLGWARPPRITKIVNSASQISPFLAGDEIARGSLLTVWGSDFELTSAKTAVDISGSWGSTPLRILRVSRTRIDARVLETIALGRALLTVTAGSEKSSAIPVIIVASQFGIFSRNGNGWGPGQIDQILSRGTRSGNSVSNSAAPGSTIVISGTGLGNNNLPEVLIAGKPATVLAAAKAPPDSAAADEITVKLPGNAPEGCFVPVQVRAAGRLPSNIVTMSIHRAESWCAPPEYLPLAGQGAGSVGLVLVARTVSQSVLQTARGPAVFDEAGAWFARLPEQDGELNPFLMPPPPDSCVTRVEGAAGEAVAVDPSLPTSLAPAILARLGSGRSEDLLDAGPSLNINDGRVQRRISVLGDRPSAYRVWFNDPSGRGGGPLAGFLAPVQLRISGLGGADIGAFRLALSGPVAFEWTNRISDIDRSRGFDVQWQGIGPGRLVMILLKFQDSLSNTRGLCYCVAPAAAGGFHVPTESLANFPIVAASSGTTGAVLMVASWPARVDSFRASGVGRAVGASVFAHSARVSLR